MPRLQYCGFSGGRGEGGRGEGDEKGKGEGKRREEELKGEVLKKKGGNHRGRDD